MTPVDQHVTMVTTTMVTLQGGGEVPRGELEVCEIFHSGGQGVRGGIRGHLHTYIHGKYVYGTEKESEIVKEETASERRKKHMYMYVYTCTCTCISALPKTQ